MKLSQLFRYRQVLGGVSKFFSATDVRGDAGPLNIYLGPPYYLEITGTRKLKLNT